MCIQHIVYWIRTRQICFPFLLITQTRIIILLSDTHVTNRQQRVLQRLLSFSKWSSVLVYDSLWKLSFSDYKKDENYSHADISAWSASSIFTAPRCKRKILVAPYVELRVVVYLNRSHLTKSVNRPIQLKFGCCITDRRTYWIESISDWSRNWLLWWAIVDQDHANVFIRLVKTGTYVQSLHYPHESWP